MSDITYRSNLTRDLTPNEVDANFRALDDTKTETTVTDALAQAVNLLEVSQAQFTQELATQGAAIAATEGDVLGLTGRMDAVETDINDLEVQASATEQALQLHEIDHQNPHQVTAQQAGADAVGTAAAVMQSHLAALDPHPQYLITAEGDARYDALGSAAAAQGSANAVSIDGLAAVMDGGLDGFLLKITGTPGNEQIVAVPASNVATPTQVAKRWFSVATEVIGPATYNLGADVEPVGLSTTKTNTVNTANTENLIAEFVSNATTSGFTVDPGLWSFKLWDRASNAGNELRIKIFILNQVTFARTQVGITHIYPLDNVIDEFDTYELSVAAPVIIAPGQRLLFALYSFSTANNRTVTISFGGADRQPTWSCHWRQHTTAWLGCRAEAAPSATT
ncbi:hypothetical protein [Pseudomonas sp. NPDC086251]|uniref:hypothetical protein n=1 Tax=Pseudomonas sp. NPDC086251 TaxID=3364431 RepID=UPI00383456C6